MLTQMQLQQQLQNAPDDESSPRKFQYIKKFDESSGEIKTILQVDGQQLEGFEEIKKSISTFQIGVDTLLDGDGNTISNEEMMKLMNENIKKIKMGLPIEIKPFFLGIGAF